MAHLTDGTLRRIIDDPDAHNEAEGRHYAGCPDCQARFKTISDDAGLIGSLLSAPQLNVDVAAAFKAVTAAPSAQPRFGVRLPLVRPMSRPMVLAFAAAIAAVALLGTVIAQNYTLLFSPTSVTPIPVTVADMQALSQLSVYGTITWTTQPNLQIVTSAADAKAISGLQPPTVATLPTGVSSTVTYAATSKAVAEFTFNAAKARAAAVAGGKTLPALPAGMDGATLTVTVGPAVGEIFGDLKNTGATDITQANLPQLVIGESSAPSASSTQVSVTQLESYLVNVPGISPELKAAIKAIGDPSTTLPIPIPVEFATSSPVQVQGVSGLAFGDNTGLGAGVVWVKHGVVYVVAGTIKRTDAINIANHLG